MKAPRQPDRKMSKSVAEIDPVGSQLPESRLDRCSHMSIRRPEARAT